MWFWQCKEQRLRAKGTYSQQLITKDLSVKGR
jgi:hypothetical protein